MNFLNDLKENKVADYNAVNYIYTRAHEVVSQMNHKQLAIISEHYPELLLLAKSVGEKDELRTDFTFTKEAYENSTQ